MAKTKDLKDRDRLETRSSNFLVSVYRQENQSWQGVIQWLDTGKKVHFRSQLEMILLIQEAMETKNGADQEFRSWKSLDGVDAIG